jgi:hypothetical protein
MSLIDVRPITSLHESFTGQSHWLELSAERKRRMTTQRRLRPNQMMKPTAPDAMTPSNLAARPWRGLSLAR